MKPKMDNKTVFEIGIEPTYRFINAVFDTQIIKWLKVSTAIIVWGYKKGRHFFKELLAIWGTLQ